MFPLCLIIYFSAPIFKNFELIESKVVDDRGEKKIAPWNFEQPVKSNYLGLKFDRRENIKALPLIEISMVDGKKYRKYGLAFFDMNTGENLKVTRDYGQTANSAERKGRV